MAALCRSRLQPGEAGRAGLAKTATIKDIMDSMVDPSADFLFDSVAQIADEHGITEKAPHTDEEWQEVRRRAIQLLEAPNLLVMKGRKVARPGDKSENPGDRAAARADPGADRRRSAACSSIARARFRKPP